MTLPNCYDAVRQEEEQQKEWDEFVDDLPVCGCCGRSVYPHSALYELNIKIKKEIIIVCEDCKSDMDETKRLLDM